MSDDNESLNLLPEDRIIELTDKVRRLRNHNSHLKTSIDNLETACKTYEEAMFSSRILVKEIGKLRGQLEAANIVIEKYRATFGELKQREDEL